MLGLMQQQPLLISSLLTHAARHHATAEVVSATNQGSVYHSTWAATERGARRLVRVLQSLGIQAQDRIGTLAWNDYRHLETYYAASGMQAICHTFNPRL
jgi:fatty-acyl-CoA synthase